jgi:hypothetical protein
VLIAAVIGVPTLRLSGCAVTADCVTLRQQRPPKPFRFRRWR